MTEDFRVVWTDVAVSDLQAIVEHVVQRDSIGAAEDLHDRLMTAVAGLEALPRRCRVVPEVEAEGTDAYRELLIGPYRVVFGLRGTDVVVLAAFDGRRDLGELLIERALRRP